MTPEGLVKKAIKDWLKANNAYFFMPVQTGYGVKTIDFLVCINGRFIGIEAKRQGKPIPTPLQEETMKQIESAGGWAFCVDSLESFLEQYLERRTK